MSFGSGSNIFQQYSSDFGLGHNGVRVSLNYFDGIPEQSMINSVSSQELTLILKMLLKRDEITKEKALVDLFKFLDNEHSSSIEGDEGSADDIFMLCWTQSYTKLAVSENKTIRDLSHQITLKLVKHWNKKITKFFRDLIPLILLGCCDSDASIRTTCNKELLGCFKNDEKKVSALWKLFAEQILELINTAIILENENTIADDSCFSSDLVKLRFDKLVDSSVRLLTKLLVINSDDKTSFETINPKAQSILTNETLWKKLNFKNCSSLKTYESILDLIRVLYEIEILQNSKPVLKVIFKNLLKFISQINQKNIMTVNVISNTIIEVLIILNNYENGKVWKYDKSPSAKIKQFLTFTSASPFPGYFKLMYQLFESTKYLPLLEIETEWLPIWVKANDALISKSFLGKHGAELLTEFWSYFLAFLRAIDQDQVNRIKEQELLKLLRSKHPMKNLASLKSKLSTEIASSLLKEELNYQLINYDEHHSNQLENALLLLLENDKNKLFVEAFCTEASQCLLGNEFERFKMVSVLFFFRILLSAENFRGSQHFIEIISSMTHSIDQDTFLPFTTYVIELSKSRVSNDLFSDSKNIEILDDFVKITQSKKIGDTNMMDFLSKISLPVFDKLYNADGSYTKIYVSKYVKSYNFQDDGKLLTYSLIKSIDIVTLYTSALANNNMEVFCDNLMRFDENNKVKLVLDTDFLKRVYLNFSNEIVNQVGQVLIPLAAKNDKVAEKLASSILERVMTGYVEEDSILLKHAVSLMTANSMATSILVPSNLNELIHSFIPYLDHRVAIISGISLNSHFLIKEQAFADLQKVKHLVWLGLFINDIIIKVESVKTLELVLFVAIIKEILTDYNCISDNPQEDLQYLNVSHHLDNAMSLPVHDVIELIFHRSFENIPEASIWKYLVPDSVTDNSVTAYYKSRIINKLLINMIDNLSHSAFEQIVPIVEGLVFTSLRNKNGREAEIDLLLTGVVLNSIEKFNGSSQFTKLRTTLGCSLIGAKDDELMNTSYKSIILLTNLMKTELTVENFAPINPHRFALILNSVSKIMDSEVIYEDSFAVLRIALLKFFEGILQSTVSFVQDFSTIEKFLADSLSMCQLSETPYLFEIRFWCLKLYLQIIKKNNGWADSEYEQETVDGIVELCFINFENDVNNQISMQYYSLLLKIIEQFDKKILYESREQFFEKYYNGPESSVVGQTRLLVIILKALISEAQQEAVIEFEFQKKLQIEKDEDFHDSEENSYDFFKLPSSLITRVSSNMPQDYLEYENKFDFMKYLWDWYLIICYFDDTSYNLRQVFIAQLKEQNLIDGIFNFVVDQINLDEVKFWDEENLYQLFNYSLKDSQFSPYAKDMAFECKILLGHLIYKLFLNVGSSTSAWWLNIQDRSLQIKSESFVSKFISPTLIEDKLDEISNNVTRLTSKNESLAIKVNKKLNEVKASYHIDEQELAISFKLPSNYPLTNIQVVGLSRVGISEQKWNQWIMSMQQVMVGMNVSMMDSLELFAKNVNLQFSGFEECAICYSILHAVDRKLPAKSCPTCNNKYHGACLYKWFRSSGNNTCPMCRSEIPIRR